MKTKNNMNSKKKVIGISSITILVVIVLVASYVLVVMPKLNKTNITEDIASLKEGEKLQVGNEGEGVTPRAGEDTRTANCDYDSYMPNYLTEETRIKIKEELNKNLTLSSLVCELL